jgi:hypothetical protein
MELGFVDRGAGRELQRQVDAYTQVMKIYADSAKLKQRGVDNGIYVDYLFIKDKGKWILFTGRDYSN